MENTGIVAFAFGVPSDIVSNRVIAHLAWKEANASGHPIFTQRDISFGTEIDKVKVEYFPKEDPQNPPPTLRIARGAVKWAKRHNFSFLRIVAVKPHLWRCRRDLERAIREEKVKITIHLSPEIDGQPKNFWFCKNSTQPRTRSWWAWWSREIILRLMPFFIYKRVAG